jgi:protein SCO1/2
MASRPDPRRRLVAAALAGALVLGACGSDGSDASGGSTTEPDRAEIAERTEIEGLQRDEPLEVGDVVLPEVVADDATEPFALRAEPGGLLFAAFGYTNCPDVCPTTLSDIRKALALMDPADAERVQVAFATVDPARDTPEVMTAYLGSFVTDGHPLRADDPAELVAAEEALGITSQVVENDEGGIDVAHTARSFVIDEEGRVVVEWAFGTGADVMASDLRLLLAELA